MLPRVSSNEMTAEKPPAQTASDAGRRETGQALILSLLLVAATLLAFWPVTGHDFVNYDDPDYVTSNLHVQRGLTWDGTAWAFKATHASNWHPLTWLSHMLDAQLFGLNAGGHHTTNLGLHIANSVLLLLLLRRLTGALWPSFFVAALFALHPLHVESVAWVSERKDVLSTLFFLLTLGAYERYARGPQESRSSARWYWTAVVLFAFGLMSKPMLVTLPFVLLLLDIWPLRRLLFPALHPPSAILGAEGAALRRLIREKLPFFLLSAASCVVTVIAQRQAMQPLVKLSGMDRLGNALVAYLRYLGMTFWPVDLAIPYPHPGTWPALQVAMATLAVGALCGLALWARNRHPYAFTGCFWFLGTMIPVIGLVQVGGQAMADRYTYMPLIGLFLAGVWGINEICLRRPSWRTAAGVGAFAALAACGLMAHKQAGYWKDNETLFRHSDAVTRSNYVALNNIGFSLFKQKRIDESIVYFRRSLEIEPYYVETLINLGAALESRDLPAAIECYNTALKFAPRNALAWFDLGNAFVAQGKNQEALEAFQAAIQLDPDHFEARNNLANLLMKMGRIDDALPHYLAALRLKPTDGKLQGNLALALTAKGRLEEALPHYTEALKYQPEDAGTHYGLGLVLAMQKRWDEAETNYTEAIRLGPPSPEAHYNLGYALRMKGDLNGAIMQLREALRLRPEFPVAHFNLGCALADSGKRDEAAQHLAEAIRLKPDYAEASERLRQVNAATAP